eukprot:1695898-Pleurochrysis_carterae.AAC.2
MRPLNNVFTVELGNSRQVDQGSRRECGGGAGLHTSDASISFCPPCAFAEQDEGQGLYMPSVCTRRAWSCACGADCVRKGRARGAPSALFRMTMESSVASGGRAMRARLRRERSVERSASHAAPSKQTV